MVNLYKGKNEDNHELNDIKTVIRLLCPVIIYNDEQPNCYLIENEDCFETFLSQYVMFEINEAYGQCFLKGLREDNKKDEYIIKALTPDGKILVKTKRFYVWYSLLKRELTNKNTYSSYLNISKNINKLYGEEGE